MHSSLDQGVLYAQGSGQLGRQGHLQAEQLQGAQVKNEAQPLPCLAIQIFYLLILFTVNLN